MKKTKNSKSNREIALERLAHDLRVALRQETANIIFIGDLLIESRKLFADEHGEWLPWLEENFDRSERSAHRYVAAAEYVAAKSATVADFTNLAPTVLYELAADDYSVEEEAAILAATHEGRVDQTRASAICMQLIRLRQPPALPSPSDADHEAVAAAAEYSEFIATPDGPPPAVPPAVPSATPDLTLRAFDQAVSTLKQLMTKPAARFAGSIHAGDLENIESFIHAVADRARIATTRVAVPHG